MAMTVHDRAKVIATLRWIEVRLMEITAAWTPTTPEMEVKVMFGRHIWDFAQHADALGKRTFELRQPEHYTLRPTDEYLALLEEIARETDTSRRLASLYDAYLPALERRYRDYLDATDRLLDEPSVVIIERVLADIARMRQDAARVRTLYAAKECSVDHLLSRENAVAHFVA